MRQPQAVLRALRGRASRRELWERVRREQDRALQAESRVEALEATQRRTREVQERRLTYRPHASFRYKTWEAVRATSWAREAGLAERDRPTFGKAGGREVARRVGVAFPTVLAEEDEVGRLPGFGSFGDALVLKPRDGHSTRGVQVLRREAGGGWVDLLTGRTRSEEDCRRGFADDVAEHGFGSAVIVEEVVVDRLVPDVPARDWKLYCFGGRVELVECRLLVPGGDGPGGFDRRFAFFDRDWERVRDARADAVVDDTLPAAVGAERLVEVAELMAAQLDRAHIRVDLYDSPRGVLFGELTPHTNGYLRLRPELDRRLGEAWERAEAVQRWGAGAVPGSCATIPR